MKFHTDYFDNFCPFYAKYINCTKDYESSCEGVSNYKGLLQTIRATYEEICVQYKTDIEALIEPCFNDLGHQTQLIDVCYNILVRYMMDRNKTPETIEACRGPEEWASCVNDVLVQCNPDKAYVFPLVYEAAKPYICNV